MKDAFVVTSDRTGGPANVVFAGSGRTSLVPGT
jgi:hypothetical protein